MTYRYSVQLINMANGAIKWISATATDDEDAKAIARREAPSKGIWIAGDVVMNPVDAIAS